ncbi:ATP-binding protein [Sphingomonas sp. GB1N7]|uniref:ATP-binding protein n=1 Tax=Parasphingomonas caseinilytica TaxID=3096158 RepID=UPI002FC7629C
MARDASVDGGRVIVCAPYGRDAESVGALLTKDGYEVRICGDISVVAGILDESIGTILVTEEALAGDLGSLRAGLAAQAAWSDVPFVLLKAQRSTRMAAASPIPSHLLDVVTNFVVLERPLGVASLLSAVASAMRARRRQFEIRDRVADLATSEGRLRLATAAADIGTWDYDPVGGDLRWDARCKAMFGLPADVAVSFDGSFLAGLHPDDRDRTASAVGAALDPGGNGQYSIEYRTIGLEDGIERWVAARGGAVFDAERATRFIGTVIDISERKQAEAALAASETALRQESNALAILNQTLEARVAERTEALEAEMAIRSQAEEALRQSQKMEAVGQLTGGIAHDFNNMLTGVIGGLDIIKRRIASGRLEDLDRFMDAASTSAQRAAALTARLLAFSRRQSLDARPLDINALTASLEDLLARTINENIALRIVPGDGSPHAVADPNQLENALLNLAINARDAMPMGGQLTIEVSSVELDEAYASAKPDVQAGRYVVIAVSDTGVGMSPDVIEKVFEPFFTTKPIGEGTGLGLSMVYGFARQSGGQVRIHSQPGEGTSVKLYLRATDNIEIAGGIAASPVQEGRGQTVLVVEDDPSVRLLVRDVLEELRYTVVEAGEAGEAIPVLASDRSIHLMVSDVGLPGMNGRQLAEIARQHRPELPILFVTGYAENAAIRAGFLGTNMGMITKPFALDVLAAKIDEMIA